MERVVRVSMWMEQPVQPTEVVVGRLGEALGPFAVVLSDFGYGPQGWEKEGQENGQWKIMKMKPWWSGG